MELEPARRGSLHAHLRARSGPPALSPRPLFLSSAQEGSSSRHASPSGQGLALQPAGRPGRIPPSSNLRSGANLRLPLPGPGSSRRARGEGGSSPASAPKKGASGLGAVERKGIERCSE